MNTQQAKYGIAPIFLIMITIMFVYEHAFCIFVPYLHDKQTLGFQFSCWLPKVYSMTIQYLRSLIEQNSCSFKKYSRVFIFQVSLG